MSCREAARGLPALLRIYLAQSLPEYMVQPNSLPRLPPSLNPLFWVFLHAFDQASRTHISPVLADVVQTGLSASGSMDGGPTSWHVDIFWPQRILTFVIDQREVGAIFVLEWISLSHCRDTW